MDEEIKGAYTKQVLELRKKWGDRGYGWLCIYRELLNKYKTPAFAWGDRFVLMQGTDATKIEFEEFLSDSINKYRVLKKTRKGFILDYGLFQTKRTQQKGNYAASLRKFRGNPKKMKELNKRWKELTINDVDLYWGGRYGIKIEPNKEAEDQ